MLNSYILDRLANYDIEVIEVFVEGENRESGQINEELAETYSETLEKTKKMLQDLSAGKELPYEEITKSASEVYAQSGSIYDIITCLNNLKDTDKYTYAHSFNVAIYGMLIAKWIGLPQWQVELVIAGGIIHDIGKVQIPDEILNKKGRLTPEEFEIMKEHTLLGYELSKKIKGLRHDVRQVILMHHEREDGAGYPFGVKGDKIHLYSKIISIADVYDAMTSERVYKPKTTPFDTFREIRCIGYGHFDTKILTTFLSSIADYYLGAKVKMDDGEVGEVVYLPPLNPSLPVVRVGEDYIDLALEKDRRVVEML